MQRSAQLGYIGAKRRSGTGHSWHCWLLTHNPSPIPPVRGSEWAQCLHSETCSLPSEGEQPGERQFSGTVRAHCSPVRLNQTKPRLRRHCGTGVWAHRR
ncbi:hypothetical protein SKAU_G00341660 [Synaphobranchus kaupii]|uniref:Uncharacterized protein n=1 Tax=Synaphobranchus kaupii TaxID=118154 RepID=A0A9Q1ENB0_SYNKA|nr:hypothetical protein SKAU_G00341660 [Synaphobranchus kaupii]